MQSPIFIIGYGRSGTHWLARTFARHKDIRATIEIQPIFSWVTEMALNPSLQRKLLWRLILRYHVQIIISTPKRYLDKSHPNIWLVEKLLRAFPNAQFVGIERNPYATVASAILHKGGEKLRKGWEKFPIPINFLGIDENIAEYYESLSLSEKYALAWKSHHDRMNFLRKSLAKSILVVQYEQFILKTRETLNDLENFLNLDKPIPKTQVRMEMLDKWRKQLSPSQINKIERIVGFSPRENF